LRRSISPILNSYRERTNIVKHQTGSGLNNADKIGRRVIVIAENIGSGGAEIASNVRNSHSGAEYVQILSWNGNHNDVTRLETVCGRNCEGESL